MGKLEYRKLKKALCQQFKQRLNQKKVSITVTCLQAESPEQSQGQPQAPSSDSESYSKLPKRDTEKRALSQVSNTCSRQKVWWASSKEIVTVLKIAPFSAAEFYFYEVYKQNLFPGK